MKSLSRREAVAAAAWAAGGIVLTNPGRARAAEPARRPRATVVGDRGGEKTYLLVFDKGEEVMGGLLGFVKDQGLVGGHLSAIGAVSNAALAFFDRATKDYQVIPVARQAEVVALTGNVALVEGEPFLHAHAVLGLPEGSTRGGHLLSAHVWPTLEVVLTGWPRPVRRARDPETGLFLLNV
jgi:predicted DNA-binding protein with PD1-like motif